MYDSNQNNFNQRQNNDNWNAMQQQLQLDHLNTQNQIFELKKQIAMQTDPRVKRQLENMLEELEAKKRSKNIGMTIFFLLLAAGAAFVWFYFVA